MAFDIFFIVFIILACILDRCNLLTMYRKVEGSNNNENEYNNYSNNNTPGYAYNYQSPDQNKRKYGDRTQ